MAIFHCEAMSKSLNINRFRFKHDDHREWFTSFYSTRYWKVWARVSHSPSLLPLCCVYSYFWKRWWKLLAWHHWIMVFLYKMKRRASGSRTCSTGHCQCWLCLAKQHLQCVYLMSCFWGPWQPLLVSVIEPETCILDTAPAHSFLRKGCCHPRQDWLLIPLSIMPGCLRHSGLSSSCWVFSSHLCLQIHL